MQLFHGISAYHGTRHSMQQISAADRCLDVEICAATRPIGPIGVIVSGEIIDVFDRDVWSYVDDQGYRRTGGGYYASAASDGVDLSDPIAVERWVKENADELYHGDYCEAFVHAKAITHVWVKKYVGEKTRKVARIIARRHRAKLVEVDQFTRPWDVLGHWDDDWEYYADMAEASGYNF